MTAEHKEETERKLQSKNKLSHFVAEATRLITLQALPESELLLRAGSLMQALVAVDDWLPDTSAQPHPVYYQQHLLYGDPLDRFSLVSFVWGPGQQTPIHNHTMWGVIGMLRGAEYGQRYAFNGQHLSSAGTEQKLEAGQIDVVAPSVGDIHRVRNAYDDRVSISIHLYGGNIGTVQRSVFDAVTHQVKPFVSSYSNALVPNLWAGSRL